MIDSSSTFFEIDIMNYEQIIKKLANIFNETLGVNEFKLSITMDEVT